MKRWRISSFILGGFLCSVVSTANAQTTASPVLSAALDSVRFDGDTLLDLFKWVARTILYEDRMDAPTHLITSEVLINEALVYRSGVCEHFAELFAAAARAYGYRAHVVHGFTEQDDSVGHAWVAVRTTNGWFEYDPTWGSGHMMDSTYHPELDMRWFKVPSLTMRKSHTPLDLVWSVEPRSISAQDSMVELYFNMDTLSRAKADIPYLEQLEQLPVVKEYMDHTKNGIAALMWNKSVEELNTAVVALNSFIDRRTHYFRKPRWDDDTIDLKSAELVLLVSNARSSFAEIDSSRIEDIELFHDSVDQAEKVEQLALKERAIAVRYLNTWRPIRASALW